MQANFYLSLIFLLTFTCLSNAQKVAIEYGDLAVPDGKIGIGTNNPIHPFQVSDGSAFQLFIHNPDAGGAKWYLGSSADWWNVGPEKFLISPTTNSSDANFTLQANGHLGLHTTSPLYPFHVVGRSFYQDDVGIGEAPGTSGQPLGISGDFAMGGGEDNFDSSSEAMLIRAQPDTWYLGARNTSDQATTNFYIGLEGSGSGSFNITNTGRVGIGTSIPASLLDVTEVNNSTTPEQFRVSNFGNGDATMRFLAGSNIFNTQGYLIGIDQSDNDKFKFKASSIAGALNTTAVMTLHPDNRVSINTTNIPTGYTFAVDGKTINEGVTVRLSQSWPDYVFDKSYQLASLMEVEDFIDQHHHLPNIPSAKQIEKNGLSLDQMQIKMMEKIEELTLYLIDQQKEIAQLKSEINTLKNVAK